MSSIVRDYEEMAETQALREEERRLEEELRLVREQIRARWQAIVVDRLPSYP